LFLRVTIAINLLINDEAWAALREGFYFMQRGMRRRKVVWPQADVWIKEDEIGVSNGIERTCDPPLSINHRAWNDVCEVMVELGNSP
jgi:hypothetical protein